MVPHRREEPASYRPTANARKHGPLQSRRGRQIRDFSRATPSFRHASGGTFLTLMDARFSSCSPRSNLTDILANITAGHPISRISELMVSGVVTARSEGRHGG
jgi:hypothetical protein